MFKKYFKFLAGLSASIYVGYFLYNQGLLRGFDIGSKAGYKKGIEVGREQYKEYITPYIKKLITYILQKEKNGNNNRR